MRAESRSPLAIRISDPYGENQSSSSGACHALDENFIVVRRQANLSLSHDLSGFHFTVPTCAWSRISSGEVLSH